MAEIKISKNLNAMLSEEDKKGLDVLTGLSEKVEEFMSNSSCDDETREKIFNKEEGLFVLIEQIIAIKNKHISNEKKREQLHELLATVDLLAILENLTREIEDVKLLMIGKGKEAAKLVMREIEDAVKNYEGLFQTAKETEAAKKQKAEEGEKKLLNSEKEQAQRTEMVKYEGKGFWDNFKKIRSEEKVGIFKAFSLAYKKTHEEKNKDVEKSSQTPEEREKIEEELKRVVEEKAACEVRAAELSKQEEELKAELLKMGEKKIEEVKEKIEEATAPVPEEEVTQERVATLGDKLRAFRENLRQKRVDRLTKKGENLDRQRVGLDMKKEALENEISVSEEARENMVKANVEELSEIERLEEELAKKKSQVAKNLKDIDKIDESQAPRRREIGRLGRDTKFVDKEMNGVSRRINRLSKGPTNEEQDR